MTRDLFSRPAHPPLADPPMPAPEPPRMRGEGRTHRCAVCGRPAMFGFGVSVLQDRPGTWFCDVHKGEGQ